MPPLRGEAVQVVKVNEESGQHCLELDEGALKRILCKPELQHKKVVVVSVAGAFRKGKSFLLDFFLRFMTSDDPKNWLGDPTAPLVGFHWRGGADRDTSGILMWSEPFLVKLRTDEEVAVLFMDTQGSFDSSSTVKQCATIFALSTMLSSKQIYNIQGNLQEDNLQHLHFFTEYGRLAMKSGSNEIPFQHLEFLIRDWSYPYDYPFGSDGGMALLNKRLEITPGMHPEHVSLRNHIMSCFSRLRCCLMPHPGLRVATSPNFDGRIADMDPEFVEQLRVFVPLLLSPANLDVKMINGQSVTCRDLMEYFKAYVKIYQSGTLPEPTSILQATAEANNLTTLIRCKEQYIRQMNEVCGPTRPYVASKLIDGAHQTALHEARQLFAHIPKMGGDEFSKPYIRRLERELAQLLIDYKESNTNKNTLQHMKTPGVLAVMLLVFYVVTGFFELIGLSIISNLFIVPFWILVVTLLTWMGVRFSGHASQVGEVIDEGAQILVDWVISPTVEKIGQRAAAHALGVSQT
uniref:GB1/RHD3-type G domain-containing protein n=1 Tax=Schistocephalus solidus TaxID=70667 RepID=A0A0X3Q3M5_SCHSO